MFSFWLVYIRRVKPLLLGAILLQTIASLYCAAAPAETRPRVVAVIDFRNDELHREFADRFRATLRLARIPAEVHFERVKLPISGDLRDEVRRLESRKPEVYYATTTVIARKIREVNPTVPIVFSGVADPRAIGIIRSIDRPENYMTGFISYADVDAKRLEILTALHPRIKRVGLLVFRNPPDGTREAVERWNAEFEAEIAATVAAALSRGTTLVPLVMEKRTDPRSIEPMIRRHRLDGIDAPTSTFVREHHLEIIRAARAARIPLSFRGGGFLEHGGVLSYEPREFDYPVKAAQMVAKILRGVATEDMPVEFPSEFVLSINLTGIAALPYEVNKGVLRRANQVYP